LKVSDQFLALLVVAIWGTNFVFIRLGLNELQPFTFAALRFFLVAFPLIFFLHKPQCSWPSLISYGLFIGLGQFGLLFWAMKADISPGLASLIVQMQVFFTVFLSAFLLQETVTKWQLVSLVICLAGLLMVILYTDGSTTYFGIVMVLLAGFSWACGNLVIKQAGKVDMLSFIAWSSLFSVPPLLLVAVLTEGVHTIGSDIVKLSWQGWLVVLWQTIGNTLVGYGLWNTLLGRYSAATVAPWALLVPVFGMVSSAILLGELMPDWKVVAAVLILLGLTVNLISQRKNQTTN